MHEKDVNEIVQLVDLLISTYDFELSETSIPAPYGTIAADALHATKILSDHKISSPVTVNTSDAPPASRYIGHGLKLDRRAPNNNFDDNSGDNNRVDRKDDGGKNIPHNLPKYIPAPTRTGCGLKIDRSALAPLLQTFSRQYQNPSAPVLDDGKEILKLPAQSLLPDPAAAQKIQATCCKTYHRQSISSPVLFPSKH